MDAREKEQYLREYSILKNQGKPFFPYAVAKDSLMACVVLAVIITVEPHLCMPRTNSPRKTSLVMCDAEV